MTKLVFVHGINNQHKSEDIILDTWIDSLRSAAGRDSMWAKQVRAKATAPFYGARIAELQTEKKPRGISQGLSGDDEANFQALTDAALEDLDEGKYPADIVAAWDDSDAVTAMGAGVHKIWLKTVARIIEKLSPLQGKLALKVLKQAHIYVTRPSVAQQIDNIVRPALEGDEPVIIVAHSLGTVVTYKLLREFAKNGSPRDCPLYITLGSPLSIKVVRKIFRKPRNRPADVMRWVNGADPEDFVALNNALTIDNFGPGVSLNISDINNGHENPHSVLDYLSDVRIAAEIAKHFP